jgi:hypothetical protein
MFNLLKNKGHLLAYQAPALEFFYLRYTERVLGNLKHVLNNDGLVLMFVLLEALLDTAGAPLQQLLIQPPPVSYQVPVIADLGRGVRRVQRLQRVMRRCACRFEVILLLLQDLVIPRGLRVSL